MNRRPLWPDGVPGGSVPAAGNLPTIAHYPAPKEITCGAAFIVCPGGGYVIHAEQEAEPVAQWLNALGVDAWVLRYRLAPHYRHPAMLQDAARAVRMVRANAAEYGVDPQRIGVIGFSAGGHLCSMLATLYDMGNPQSPDPVELVSSRPDVAVLAYPVVTLQAPFGNEECRKRLLGDAPSAEEVARLSGHLQVTLQTPPMFLVHSANDATVPCEHSRLMAEALSRAGVSHELHILAQGDHGYGLGVDIPGINAWPALCGDWLRTRGFMDRK